MYQIQNNEDYTEPNIYGELHLGNQDSIGYNSDAELYDWEVENFEFPERGCWTIQSMLKNLTRQCFYVSIILKIFERKIIQYPSLVPKNKEVSSQPTLQYKERESPILHVE